MSQFCCKVTINLYKTKRFFPINEGNFPKTSFYIYSSPIISLVMYERKEGEECEQELLS